MIVDSENMGKTPRLYVLRWAPLDPTQSINNWSLELGYMSVKGGSTIEMDSLKPENMVWSCPMYAGPKLARMDTQKQVLSIFQEGDLEIDYPYELTYRFGGTVHTL
jgi:hypothetical protein